MSHAASRCPALAPRSGGDLGWGLAVVVWVVAVVLGMTLLWRYKPSAGAPDSAPAHWPSASLVERSPVLPTLVMFVHPKCACSRASIAELSRLMTDVQGRASAPRSSSLRARRARGGLGGGPTSGAARRRSLGVSVRLDADGAEAARFGAIVSGTTMLYGIDGSLLFHGGNHVFPRPRGGDNAGRWRITSLVNVGKADLLAQSPTYGCDLQSADERTGRKRP